MQGRHHVRPRSLDVGAELTSAPLVIGIDGSRAVTGRPTGTERYSIELLNAIAELGPPEDIRVYLNTDALPAGLSLPGRPVLLPARRFWTLRTLALEMRRNPPNLLFIPSHVIPPAHPRAVVTIHDLGYLVEPDCHEPRRRKQLEWTTRWNARRASGIVAVSETTRNDLVDYLGIAPNRIHVIHHGVSEAFRPASAESIEMTRKRYGIGPRTVLAVGTIQPRKNLVRLIQAFEHVAAFDPSVELVFCGSPGWRSERILDRAVRSPFHERIRHLGYVPDAEMRALYTSSRLLAFPSLYEGFGMPALEAMACGTPVLAADRSALPEICGDAALLVDPIAVESLAQGMERLLNDEELRKTLVARGIERAARFRWKNSAEQTLAFLRSIGDNEQWDRERLSKRGMQ